MSEWGPWIDHDGKGCPVPVGTLVHVRGNMGNEDVAVVTDHSFSADSQWIRRPMIEWVRRYRIRRPRALIEMIKRIENLPVREPEDA